MKKFIVLVCLLGALILNACSPKESQNHHQSKQSEAVKALKIGQTYKFGKSQAPNATYVKLLDESHYVLMIDDSHYTKEELEEMNQDEDSVDIYPSIFLIEGSYSKNDDDFLLTPEKRVIVEFKKSEQVKRKVIASKDLTTGSKSGRLRKLTKKNGQVIEDYQGYDTKLYETTVNLPNSIDDFLSQYDYQPEELD